MVEKQVDFCIELIATVPARYRRRPTFRLEVPWAVGSGSIQVSGLPSSAEGDDDAANASGWQDFGAKLLDNETSVSADSAERIAQARFAPAGFQPFGTGGAVAVLPAAPLSQREACAALHRLQSPSAEAAGSPLSWSGLGRSTFLLTPPLGASGWERFDCLPTDVLETDAKRMGAGESEDSSESSGKGKGKDKGKKGGKGKDKGKGKGKGSGAAPDQAGEGGQDRAAATSLRASASAGRPCSIRLRVVFRGVRVGAALAGRLARGMPAHLYVCDEDGPREVATSAIHSDRRGGEGNREVRRTLRSALVATGRTDAVAGLRGDDDSSSSSDENEDEDGNGMGASWATGRQLMTSGSDHGRLRPPRARPGQVSGGAYAACLPIDLSGLLAPPIRHAVPAGHDARTETARAFGSMAAFGTGQLGGGGGVDGGAGNGPGPVVGLALGADPIMPAHEDSESKSLEDRTAPLGRHPYFACRTSLPGLEPRPLAPCGLLGLEVRVAASAPLLTAGLRSVLNPLVVDIRGARRLPGLQPPPGCDPDVGALARPTPHSAPRRLCRPVFASVRILERSELRRVATGGRGGQNGGEAGGYLPIHVAEDALGDLRLPVATNGDGESEVEGVGGTGAVGGKAAGGDQDQASDQDGGDGHGSNGGDAVTFRVVSGVRYPSGVGNSGESPSATSADSITDVATARRQLMDALEAEQGASQEAIQREKKRQEEETAAAAAAAESGKKGGKGKKEAAKGKDKGKKGGSKDKGKGKGTDDADSSDPANPPVDPDRMLTQAEAAEARIIAGDGGLTRVIWTIGLLSSDVVAWHHRAVVLAGCVEFGDDAPPAYAAGGAAGAAADRAGASAGSGAGSGSAGDGAAAASGAGQDSESKDTEVDSTSEGKPPTMGKAGDMVRQGSELAPTLQRFRQYLRRSSVEVKVHDRWAGDGCILSGIDFGSQEDAVPEPCCGNRVADRLLVPRDAREAMDRCLTDPLVDRSTGMPTVGPFSASGRLRGETWTGQRARWEASARFVVACLLAGGGGGGGDAGGGGGSGGGDKGKGKGKGGKDKGKGKGKKDAGAAHGSSGSAGPLDLVRLGCAAPRLLPVVAGAPVEAPLTPADLALLPPPKGGQSGTGEDPSWSWEPPALAGASPSPLLVAGLAYCDRAVTREGVEDREQADQQNPHAVVKARLHALLDASSARLAAIRAFEAAREQQRVREEDAREHEVVKAAKLRSERRRARLARKKQKQAGRGQGERQPAGAEPGKGEGEGEGEEPKREYEYEEVQATGVTSGTGGPLLLQGSPGSDSAYPPVSVLVKGALMPRPRLRRPRGGEMQTGLGAAERLLRCEGAYSELRRSDQRPSRRSMRRSTGGLGGGAAASSVGFEDTGAEVLFRCTLWRPLGFGLRLADGVTSEGGGAGASPPARGVARTGAPSGAAAAPGPTGSVGTRRGAARGLRLQNGPVGAPARDADAAAGALRRREGPRGLWEEPPLPPLGRIVLVCRRERDGTGSELGRALAAVARINSGLLHRIRQGEKEKEKEIQEQQSKEREEGGIGEASQVGSSEDASAASVGNDHGNDTAQHVPPEAKPEQMQGDGDDGSEVPDGTDDQGAVSQTQSVSALQVYHPEARDRLRLKAADPFFDGITGVQLVDDNWRVLVLEGRERACDAGWKELAEEHPELKLKVPQAAGKRPREDGEDTEDDSEDEDGMEPAWGEGSLAKVRRAIGREQFNRDPREADGYRLLSDPLARFEERLYADEPFCLFPRTVRLREPLAQIVSQAGLYRQDLGGDALRAAGALQTFWQLRRAGTLSLAARASLFPRGLDVVLSERRFGGAATERDVLGLAGEVAKAEARAARERSRAERVAKAEGGVGTEVAAAMSSREQMRPMVRLQPEGSDQPEDLPVDGAGHYSQQQDEDEGEGEGGRHPGRPTRAAPGGSGANRRKAPTDARNDEYLAHLEAAKVRREHEDAVRRNMQQVSASSTALTQALEARGLARHQVRQLPEYMVGKEADEVHIYSGMRKGWTNQQRRELMGRLAADRTGQYSYSKEFGSATVVLVDEEEEKQRAREQDIGRRTTQRGFQYPAPTRPQDRNKHPKGLSYSRAADLRQPWVDPNDVAAVEAARARQQALASGRGPWAQPSSIGGSDAVGRGGGGGGPHLRGTFGFVDPTTGERRDGEFFTSVHVGGQRDAEEHKAAVAREQAAKDALVITDRRFRPHVPSQRPAQSDKATGLLAGPPRSLALKQVHRARLPSGKETSSLRLGATSALAADPYADPTDFTAKLRPVKTDTGGRPEFSAIGRGDGPKAGAGGAAAAVSRRSHVAVDAGGSGRGGYRAIWEPRAAPRVGAAGARALQG